VLGIALLVAGCSKQGVDEAESPYASDFRTAMDGASDYVRSILKDGVVSFDELVDAQNHVIDCLKQHDIGATYQTDAWGQSNLVVDGILSPSEQAIDYECETQWMGQAGYLYWAIRSNPEKLDPNDAIAACLVRKGLVPEGFTGKDFEAIMAPFTTSHSGNETVPPGDSVTPDTPVVAPTLPGGLSVDDWAVVACRMNPQSP